MKRGISRLDLEKSILSLKHKKYTIQSFVSKDQKMPAQRRKIWEISFESKLAVDVEKSLQPSFLLMGRLNICKYGKDFLKVYIYSTVFLLTNTYIKTRKIHWLNYFQWWYLLVVDEAGHDVDGDGENDGAVVLCRDGAQRLKIPQLGVSSLSVWVQVLEERDNQLSGQSTKESASISWSPLRMTKSGQGKRSTDNVYVQVQVQVDCPSSNVHDHWP